MKAQVNLYPGTKCTHQIAILTGFLLLLPLVSNGGQAPTRGIRIITPQDGATVEPGQRFAVAVEAERGVTPAFIAVLSDPIIAMEKRPPFSLSVSYPADVPLGPKKFIVNGRDTRDRPLRAEITLHIETPTPVKSIQVTEAPLFLAPEESISVSGVFADGVRRRITRSQETRFSSSNPKVAIVSSAGLIEAIDNGTATITVTYKNQSFSFPVKVEYKKLTVSIKIRPESPRNEVNLASKGRLPVAIFSTRDFNATEIEPDTVRFGPKRARPIPGGDDRDNDRDDDRDREERERRPDELGKIEDINGDGLPDLLLHFRIQEIGLTCADKQANLTGFTLRRELISGTDSVLPVGPSCP